MYFTMYKIQKPEIIIHVYVKMYKVEKLNVIIYVKIYKEQKLNVIIC